ncbi:PglL family O-oligosaccharyltransferase [Alysiella crassa]|uniref:Lipid A core - O-antigen ligase and related enzymes n=1 Tax=Alysiella crassa TaxID=153491 RepID=A0A376BVQ0_9NEIS|nr:PglL family O-oligosaccharyltransferase [Alysiella crassa]UOP06403.1 PglL family O-oligosaccharyltransferase [Alysiella crassa]SSY80921.1 Lipid A core - O-antigen ligase and related enzymes [Alysiella crassa]
MNNPLFKWSLLPLWVGLALLFVPFLSIWRVGMLSSFYLESMSLLFTLLLVMMTVLMFWQSARHHHAHFSGSLKANLPPTSLYFLVLAIFWAIQGRAMDVPYVGQNDMVAWTFVAYALLAWACRQWVARFGQERVVSIFAWLMMVAAGLQAAVAWAQYTGYAAEFAGYLMYRKGIIEGQLGQYNHLGHFMMWGILAAGYLWGVRRIKWWLAVPVLLYLTATTGIISSRALMAYVMAMAIVLPLARVFGGKTLNRVAICMGVATAGVIAFQFALEPIMQLFNEQTNLNSSLERLSGHSHEGSGRSHEWQKAWQVFQSAPIWGHGWGSYPAQSFLLAPDVYKTGFRLYDPNVLFTHSHNSFLNLLAEMGLVGTLLILGGLAWTISGCLKTRNAPSLLLLALMAVSLTHSVLEYPLWYIYFLTIFALFPSFMTTGLDYPETETDTTSQTLSGSLKINWYGVVMGFCALIMALGIVRLAFVYNDLVIATKKNNTSKERAEQIMHLLMVSKTEPMLAHYADLTLINFTHTNQAEVASWANLAQRSIAFRPYAHAYKNGLLLYRQGKIDEAKRWMYQTYRYYPHQMPVYGNEIMLGEYYPELREQYTQQCKAYQAANKHAPACAEALPPKDKLFGKSNH